MDENWKKIYETNSHYKAEFLSALLKENGIDVVLVNKKDSMYLFGDIEILVHSDGFIKALQILKDV